MEMDQFFIFSKLGITMHSLLSLYKYNIPSQCGELNYYLGKQLERGRILDDCDIQNESTFLNKILKGVFLTKIKLICFQYVLKNK